MVTIGDGFPAGWAFESGFCDKRLACTLAVDPIWNHGIAGGLALSIIYELEWRYWVKPLDLMLTLVKVYDHKADQNYLRTEIFGTKPADRKRLAKSPLLMGLAGLSHDLSMCSMTLDKLRSVLLMPVVVTPTKN